MAEIKGTNVASKIVPYTDSDEYATHDEKYGVGGYRTVDSVSEMNAIPAARRKEGMLVYVKNDRYYRLNSSNTFVDAGIINSGSDVQIYQVNIAKLNFNTILDGSEATNDQINEAGACIAAWLNNIIVLYNDPTYFIEQGGYVGTLNMSFNHNENTICFILPHNKELGSGVYLYRLDYNSNIWNVVPLDGTGSGSSNIKILTTSGLFSTSRNKSVTLNSNDAAIINSLANNNYKNVQLYYVGDPAGDNGIYPVNIASNSLSSSLSLGDVIYLSILADNGNIKSEALDYNSSTNISTKENNADDKNWTIAYNLSRNGYQKFNNGLMIQWGYSSSSGRNKTIYMPTSFYDTNYSVLVTMKRTVDDTTNYTGDVWTQNKSSFLMFGLYHSTDTNNGAFWGGFNWFAIGRWK